MSWVSSVAMNVSAIICDSDGDKIDIANSNKKSSSGAVNLSKNQDNSAFFDIDLNKVSNKISSVWFVANMNKKSFSDVESVKINFMNKKEKVFSTFDLNFD